jgi:hypothetical protein
VKAGNAVRKVVLLLLYIPSASVTNCCYHWIIGANIKKLLVFQKSIAFSDKLTGYYTV